MEYGPPAVGVLIFNIHFPESSAVVDDDSPQLPETLIKALGDESPQNETSCSC